VFENITLINENKKGKIKEHRADWSDSVVFSKGTMLSVPDKSESVNECTHTDKKYSMGMPEVLMN